MFTRRDFLGIVGTAGALAGLEVYSKRAPLRGATNGAAAGALPPDRPAVLTRNSPRVRSVDQNAVLSVGNGNFAFNMDCTGLQTLSAEYRTIPLATLSHWGWHSLPLPAGMNVKDFRYKQWPFYGRTIPYATDSSGQTALFNYLRENPHRLNLGRISFLLDGKAIAATQLSDIDQQLELATGVVISKFSLAGAAVEVRTCCHAEMDGIGLRVASPLVTAGRLTVEIAFPYGSTVSNSSGADWTKPDRHTTTLFQQSAAQATLNRTLDATRYGTRVGWGNSAGVSFKQAGPHTYVLAAASERGLLDAAVVFDREPSQSGALFGYEDARKSSSAAWNNFWMTGAAIDFSNCTDERAAELERRVVLSQYLTAIHCAGENPSQETGLLCNSWYGKFHLEMHWWHSVHFTIWNRHKQFDRTMTLYTRLLDAAKARAKFQGFKGARWPKMIGPDGEDSPSSVGPMLIWQQPHPIYYAELSYRHAPTHETLNKWREIVFETADFLASFAQYVQSRDQYVLGPPIKTVSENNPTDTTTNPTYEVTAWRFGLRTAQTWSERLGMPRNAEWDAVLAKLSPAPTQDGAYLMEERMDTYSKKWAYEHPALLGAYGVLPGDGIDPAIMATTVKKVRAAWDFNNVWGWDFPMAAMAATRTQQPELALDILLMKAPEAAMNGYLPNGCNFQRVGVPAYFPGNGGLLATIGMMAGGWTGGPDGPLPGFPKNGKWNVRAEGFGQWM